MLTATSLLVNGDTGERTYWWNIQVWV